MTDGKTTTEKRGNAIAEDKASAQDEKTGAATENADAISTADAKSVTDRRAERTVDMLVSAERRAEENRRERLSARERRMQEAERERTEEKDVCFIGFGNMARAFAKGLAAGRPELKITATDKSLGYLSDRKLDGIMIASSNADAVKRSRVVFLMVKPQNLSEVMDEILPSLTTDKMLVSILAGTPITRLRSYCGEDIRICRAMPNLAATVQKSVTAVAFDGDFSEDDVSFLSGIFGCVGEVLELEEEKFDAVTALSGGGPAYFMKFLSCLIEAGKDAGLSEEESKKLAYGAWEGAFWLSRDGAPPERLVDSVCSPRGTTIEAVNVFEKRGLRDIVSDAVGAAARRSEELSRDDGD